MHLTKTQQDIVEAAGKNVLVSAGAGTGKTRVLVERFLHLVTSGQALVTEILALTFTEKAAMEMKSRILSRFQALGLDSARRDLESSYISTIHAFGARLLREHPIEAGCDPEFEVLEEEEADQLKEQALDESIEAGCTAKDGTFELLKVFGEPDVRLGVKKVFTAARTEGWGLSEFFAVSASLINQHQILDAGPLFQPLGEQRYGEEWARFYEHTSWDWETVEDFKLWSEPFSRRGGKKDRALWKEIAAASRRLIAARIEGLSRPWQERFERLALDFEARYDAAARAI